MQKFCACFVYRLWIWSISPSSVWGLRFPNDIKSEPCYCWWCIDVNKFEPNAMNHVKYFRLLVCRPTKNWILIVSQNSLKQILIKFIKIHTNIGLPIIDWFTFQDEFVLIAEFLVQKYCNVFTMVNSGRKSWQNLSGNFCQAQFQSSPSPVQLELRLALILVITPHPPPPTPGGSRFEPFLDYLGCWTLVWKLYSTKIRQLAM